MAKKDELEDELADFDPEAPPENPPDELAIERRRQGLQVGALVVLLGIVGWIVIRGILNYGHRNDLIPHKVADPMVNLQGMEITTLGAPLEGPYIMVEAKSAQQVLMSAMGGGGAELFTLIGIDGPLDLTPAKVSATGAVLPTLSPQKAGRVELQRQMEPFQIRAIKEYCGSKRHFIMRKSLPNPNKPSMIYLFQPEAAGSDPNHPVGAAVLVNAALVRNGIVELKIEQQPFFDPPMVDCQLAAIVEARHSKQTGGKVVSIWTLYDPPMPDIANLEARMQRVAPYVN